MRMTLHSILMRSGIEKTNETCDNIISNEEKWLSGTLPTDGKSLRDLNEVKSILTMRNDLVLPVYRENETDDLKSGKIWHLFVGVLFGMILPLISILLILLVFWNCTERMGKGIFIGNCLILLILI